MVETKRVDRLLFARTVSVSVLAHAVLLVLLAIVVVPRALETPPERVLAVDIVSPEQVATLQRPRPAVAAAAPDEPPPVLAATAPEPAQPQVPEPSPAKAPLPAPATPARGKKIQATDFYAAGILSDPSNAEVRRNFKQLASSEQLVQLCNIEALEQIGRDEAVQAGPAPDVVVGYAFGDLNVSGTTLLVDGGAYRQRGAWFRVRFACTSNPQMTAITSFDYTLGDSVPKSEWEDHALNADDEGLD